MSRLTDLIAQAKSKDDDLGRELEREFKALASRRSFGLNFERHTPESVELPGRPVRKGDKVRVLPPRGSNEKGDKRLWKVVRTTKEGGARAAQLDLIGTDEPETQTVPVEDLIVVAEFRDYIYPGLVSTGKVERGGDRPFHTVINGENFHALEALTFTHRGKVDAIYIDPPYNSGARDWKYNNDYVAEDDLYRHSKWLAFLERRLAIARQLLNPKSSVLIATIDEKEYLRLGLLLEQVFPEANMQMVSSVINPKGTGRGNEMLRVNEFIFFLWFGEAKLGAFEADDEEEDVVAWETMRRRNLASRRGRKGKGACGPNQFYPIYVDEKTGHIREVGAPLPEDMPIGDAPQVEGCVAVFPIRPDGTEMNWSLTDATCKLRLEGGYVRAGRPEPEKPQKYVIQFLLGGAISAIESGDAEIVKTNQDGSIEARYVTNLDKTPTTQWNRRSHNAEHNGTNMIKKMLPGRTFPFPKSLYAVEDALWLFVHDKPKATIVDFFAGSGTTAHATMRLNRKDGGRRKAILVTNNEVSADEQADLREAGYREGDPEWEQLGICDYVTKPRTQAAISGITPEGRAIESDYRFNEQFPMSQGLEENAEFFTLTYETPVAVSHNRAFARIAPLLWMRAGSEGRRIDALPEAGWTVADTYGLLIDLDAAAPFVDAVEAAGGIRVAYIVTDDDRRFQSVAQRLPEGVETVRLYESYLANFRFAMGR
ncbi:site-specific DNA-methyltransferase [Phaeobacter inhibens]|uniref:site-specific DNA-methyltransferase n=1 Tax=Phaeobacter inhibens TaxID=221822 RepID=UPI00076BB2FC|nr:DNA methyltransferase [Phaeobacter inhibens]KXF90268.1 DNA methyltransferase [Phaeobacter inhibens]WHP69111.1 DNA methyltransferase [Phaeobacter inhibens]